MVGKRNARSGWVTLKKSTNSTREPWGKGGEEGGVFKKRERKKKMGL